MATDPADSDPEGPPGPEGDLNDPDGRADLEDVTADPAPLSDSDPGSELDPEGPHTALPPKLEAWRRRSATGAILTGLALGLQEALDTRKEEPSIVMETSGDPPRDLPVEAEFEYLRPRQSVVSIRPWLLGDGVPQTPESPVTDDAETAGDDGPSADR